MTAVRKPAAAGKGHVSTLRAMLGAFHAWKGVGGVSPTGVQETLMLLGGVLVDRGLWDAERNHPTAAGLELLRPRGQRSHGARQP